MPSFLRRLSTITSRSTSSSNNTNNDNKTTESVGRGHRASLEIDNRNNRGNKKSYILNSDLQVEGLRRQSTNSNGSGSSSSSSSTSSTSTSSQSAIPTLSSVSSLSLPPSLSEFSFSPIITPSGPSRQQSSEGLNAASKQHQQQSCISNNNSINNNTQLLLRQQKTTTNSADVKVTTITTTKLADDDSRRGEFIGDQGNDGLSLLPPPGSIRNNLLPPHRQNSAHSSNGINIDTNQTHLQPQQEQKQQQQQMQPEQTTVQKNPKKDDLSSPSRRHSALPSSFSTFLSTSKKNSNNNHNSVNERASISTPSSSSSSSNPKTTTTSTATLPPPPQQQMEAGTDRKMKRSSLSSIAILFHPKSSSMPILQNESPSHIPGGFQQTQEQQQQHYQTTNLHQSPVSSLLPSALTNLSGSSTLPSKGSGSHKRASLDSAVLTGGSGATSPRTLNDKKSRRKSLSSMLMQSNEPSSPLPSKPGPSSFHPKGNSAGSNVSNGSRWASRGGIGNKNEMMVDLEASGVFVPSSGKRLRAEFVYKGVIQCADEIRRRGLDHPNIFLNPSPKKVISAMISLMTDRERSDLYTTECLRIDTVASLMLNLLSQMSNPVVPYAIMAHYFQQGSMLPLSRRSSSAVSPPLPTPGPTDSHNYSTTPPLLSTPMIGFGASLPVIPALPVSGRSSPVPSSSILAWSREHFDLPMFLEVLPMMNRVILLEVLHLCAEVLQHQLFNRLTLSQLVQQVAPALFSTGFDQRALEQMTGGSRRCSIHCDRISAEEGSRAENHLFTVILVRFLYITSASPYSSESSRMMSDWDQSVPSSEFAPSVTPEKNGARTPSSVGGASTPALPSIAVGGEYSGSSTQFRKSQELLQQEQQEHYQKMARTFQEMEIQQDPRLSQHFGQYTASQKQQQQQYQQYLQQQKQQKQQPQNQRPQSISTTTPPTSTTITTTTTTTTTTPITATSNDRNVNDLAIGISLMEPMMGYKAVTGSSAGGSSSKRNSNSGGAGMDQSHGPSSEFILPHPNQDPIADKDHFWQDCDLRLGTGVAL